MLYSIFDTKMIHWWSTGFWHSHRMVEIILFYFILSRFSGAFSNLFVLSVRPFYDYLEKFFLSAPPFIGCRYVCKYFIIIIIFNVWPQLDCIRLALNLSLSESINTILLLNIWLIHWITVSQTQYQNFKKIFFFLYFYHPLRTIRVSTVVCIHKTTSSAHLHPKSPWNMLWCVYGIHSRFRYINVPSRNLICH